MRTTGKWFQTAKVGAGDTATILRQDVIDSAKPLFVSPARPTPPIRYRAIKWCEF
jgi:hypothetical protein